MPTVTYNRAVSDDNVKTILQRIANQMGKNISVHSGDRHHVPSGGSTTSLHLQHRAADLHVQGTTDGEAFTALKAHYNDFFDSGEAYEVIHHGRYTETEAEHLHIGRYGENRRGYVDFKIEGDTLATKGNYRSERKMFTTPGNAPLPPTAASGISVDASILSPNVGVYKNVGIGGDNRYGDVHLVQSLLNKARPRLKEAGVHFQHFNRLAEDGDCGRFTKAAITIFQRDVMGMREPDGRVDAGGKTIRALYVAAYGPVDRIARRVTRVNTHTTPTNGAGAWNGVLAWGAHKNVNAQFRDKTMQICAELKIKNPSWLMTLMAFETGRTFSPSKKNEAGSSGTGLIQFMKTTIDGYTDKKGVYHAGIGKKLGITHSQLAGMSAVRQLDIVKEYFKQFGTKAAQAKDVDDLYFLVLYPAAFGKEDNDTVFRPGTKEYRQNSGLDKNGDGRVSVVEVSKTIRAMYREGLDKYSFRVR